MNFPLDDRTTIILEPGTFPSLVTDGQPVRLTTHLRSMLDRLAALVDTHGLENSRHDELVSMIKKAVERASLYAVFVHEGRRFLDGDGLAKKAPEYGRERFLDDKVLHVDLKPQRTTDGNLEDPELVLMRANKATSPLVLLGVKPRDTGPSAVYLPSHELPLGLQMAFGDRIAAKVIEENRLDKVQFLTILAHREGQHPTTDVGFNLPPGVTASDDYDGLIADIDHGNWQKILAAFQLPASATWLQVSILDRDQGCATKGALRRCPDGIEPAVYSASWKIGMPEQTLPTSSVLVHESDATYRPEASLNLQMLAYNFNGAEQQVLIDEVFRPGLKGLLDYQWTEKLRGVDRLLAAGADIRLEPICNRVNALRRKLAREGIHRVVVPGFRAKVAPDPELAPFAVRVPEGTIAVGAVVDITRDPSLPVGTSTQRFNIVGYTEGFTLEVGPDPWMTVMGGDYDGDDACVQQTTVNLFPDKVYDKTAVSEFRNAKGRRRTGVEDEKARFEQGLRVLERPIGIHDITARRMMERGALDDEARLKLSAAIQAAIDSAKHAADVVDPGYQTEGDHAIDAIRRGDLQSACIKGSLYEGLVETAIEVAAADLEPVTFDPMPIRLAHAALAARFSGEALADASLMAGMYGTKFAEICQDGCREIDIEKLVDSCCVDMESVARRLATFPIDMEGVTMTREDLCLTAAEITLLRRASIHLGSRAIRMQSLRVVFDASSHFVRQALAASKTCYLRAATP